MTIAELGPAAAVEPGEVSALQKVGRLSILDKNTIGFDRSAAQILGLPNATHLRRMLLERSLFATLPACTGESFEVEVRPPMNAADVQALGGFCTERGILFDPECELTEERGSFQRIPQLETIPEGHDPGTLL